MCPQERFVLWIQWFESLSLPEEHAYVVQCRYVRWEGKSRRRIVLRCDLFRQSFAWDAFCVYAWGSVKVVEEGMVLVDDTFVGRFPRILMD